MKPLIHIPKSHYRLPWHIYITIVAVAMLGLSSCNQKALPEKPTTPQVYWPAPPDQPRFRYIMSIFSSDDIQQKNNSQRFQEFLTGKRKAAYQLSRPLDIAVIQGKIYLIDSISPVIHVFDLTRKRYFYFGYRFEGKLAQPVSLTVDENGLVYVADRKLNSIIVYDSMGLYLRHFELDGLIHQIAGISTDSAGNNIYIVDRGGSENSHHQLVTLNKQGELIKRLGKRGKAQGEFNLASDIAVDSQQNIYVLDSGNFRVQVFNRWGKFIKSWGQVGTGLGQFGRPKSITIDQDSHLYISDAQFGNVQVFDTDGQLLLSIGELSSHAGAGRYSLITGITADRNRYLYVLDQYYKKIDIFKKLSIY